MRTLTIAAALVASASFVAAKAHADSAADAEAQFRIGVSLQRVDDFEAAVAAYEASLRLHPTKSALFNLANCLRAAHRYPEALCAFEDLLTQHGAALDPEMRSATEEQLQALRRLVGTLSVKVVPQGAEIFVDGHPVGQSPLPAPLPLAVGWHDVEAKLDGFQTQLVRVEVRSAATAAERLVLVASPPPAPVSTSASEPMAPEPPRLPEPPRANQTDNTTTLGWLATGVGTALVLGGAGTGMWALGLDASLDDDCPRGHCPAARASDIDRLETLVATTNILVGAGTALAAVGIAVLVLAPSPADPTHDATVLGLGVGRNLIGAQVRSEF